MSKQAPDAPQLSEALFSDVEQYICGHLVPADAALDAALAAADSAQLPAIQVTPNAGKLLHLLARMRQARRILEIGTLAGYSTIWMARALPTDGRLITLEFDAKHAEIAKANFVRAGLSDRIELKLGRASDSLAQLAKEKATPFDLIFIDADKASIPDYIEASLKLSHPGSVIVVDNVVRDGKILDAESEDANVVGVRRMYEMLARDARLSATALQTVGSKGYDGLLLAIVN